MVIDKISPIGSAQINVGDIQSPTFSLAAEQNNFLDMLVGKLESIDNSIKKSDSLIDAYVRGEEIPVHDIMIALGKSKTELQLAVEIRNKLLESYQEITRIQL